MGFNRWLSRGLWFLGINLALLVGSGAAEPGIAYTFLPAFGGVHFQSPTQVVFAPADHQRAFITELHGTVAVVKDRTHPTREVFLDLSAQVGPPRPDHGTLSLAFHPKFAQNGQFFLWYSLTVDGQRYNRLSRFMVSASDPNRADPSSELILINQKTGPNGHDGGTILFGSDNYLYLSIGDGDEGDVEANASHQNIEHSFFGAVIRIDVDKKPGNLVPTAHPSVNPGAYLVPADNPFVNVTQFNGNPVDASHVRTEFWAVGLRNPFRMAFDSDGTTLWCADVGLDAREEIDLITRGANYGWNFSEGSLPGPNSAAAPANVTFTPPVWEYAHDLGLSVTGGIIYHGKALPELEGKYIFSDFVSGRVSSLQPDAGKAVAPAAVREIASLGGVVDFTVDPVTGDLLAVNLLTGTIQRLTNDSGVASASSRLANLSSRGLVGKDGQVMISGFIVSGGARTVLIRAVGPGLDTFGVSGLVAKPVLELHDASKILMTNQGWENAANLSDLKAASNRIAGFPLAAGSADSAILATLPPGGYTAVVSGANGTTGVALLEIYEVDSDSSITARLSNISTRAQVNSGDAILIAGMIIGGTTPHTVLVRAAGPALSAFGVSPVLAKPTLQLFVGLQPLLRNTGWGTAPDLEVLRPAMTVAGFPFPENSTDSAILVTLNPGAYTFQVSGADGGTGVSLLEIYEVPR